MKRKVKLELIHGTWFVLYCDRTKFKRYAAAQFWSKDNELTAKQKAIDWIAKNPKIELV